MRVTVKNGLFWDLAPCSFLEHHQSFRGKYFPHNRGQSMHFYVYVLKVGTARVFRNVSTFLRISTASHTKTQYSSYLFFMLTEVTNKFLSIAQRYGCQHQSDVERRPSEHPLHNHHHHHYCHRWRCSGKLWVLYLHWSFRILVATCTFVLGSFVQCCISNPLNQVK